MASTPPMGSSSPISADVVMMPDTSVGISCEALSVSISQIISPALQYSPVFFFHSAIYTVLMDSPTAGTFIWVGMNCR